LQGDHVFVAIPSFSAFQRRPRARIPAPANKRVLALQLFGAFAVGYVAGNEYNISHSEDNGSRTRHGVSTIGLSV
jgi:hypothetical protein